MSPPHETIWHYKLPLDPRGGERHDFVERSLEVLKPALKVLEGMHTDPAYGGRTSIHIMEAVLPSKNFRQYHTASILLEKRQSVFGFLPWFETNPEFLFLQYSRSGSVNTGRGFSPWKRYTDLQTFRLRLNPERDGFSKVQKGSYKDNAWRNIGIMGELSPVQLLTDLMTDQTWHQPTRVEWKFPLKVEG